MIEFELLEDEAILIVYPQTALGVGDFEKLAESVDPFIEQKGPLSGLMIETETFPGWDSFSAIISHLRFVQDHHRSIKKVAAVTDSDFLAILPSVANHFIAAEVKHFKYSDKAAALEWIRQ